MSVKKKNFLSDFTPQFFISMKTYTKDKFIKDLMAGIIVGIVALPLAIAFGIASGVSPEKGLFTAVIGGFIVSFLGGSTVQIGGPTGAFIVIVFGIIQQFGMPGLLIATFLAGIMLVAMGFLKLGTVIKFIPYPIIVGFTAGIALTIFSTQIKDLFGLQIEGGVPSGFIEKWATYIRNFGSVNWWVFAIGIASILIIIYSSKLIKKIPGSLIAIIVITVLAYFIRHIGGIDGIETIGDRFSLDGNLPDITPIHINLESIRILFPSAFTIAILCAIESLLSGKVADGVTGDKMNSNMELVAQGAANIIVPLFGGIPVTGAIARTMTNINNGGRSPMAGIIHAVVLLLILLFLVDLTKHIPMACLAGVLVVVSYNMSEWRSCLGILKGSKSDAAVLVTTFLLTVIFDLTIAIEVGLILAIFLFIRRITETTKVSVIKDKLKINEEENPLHSDDNLKLPKGVEVYEIDGPFFFGIANKFDESMRTIGETSKVRIIRMRKVPFIDGTALHNLEILCTKSQKEDITIILSGVRTNVRIELEKAHFPQLIGEQNICDNIHLAVKRADEILGNLKYKNV